MHHAFGKRQLVGCGCRRCAVFNLGLDLACSLAITTLDAGGRRTLCQLAAELVEILALRNNGAAGFGRGQQLCLAASGDFNHRARFEPVDVPTYEGIGVAAKQGYQHLVKRNAGGLVLCSNFSGGIAGLHDNFLAVRGCAPRRGCSLRRRGLGDRGRSGGWRAGRERRCGCGSNRRWRCGGQAGHGRRSRPRNHRRGRRSHGWRGSLTQVGWVKQHRVVTHDAPGCPASLEDQVNKRFGDGAGTAQAQEGTAIRAALQADLNIGHRCAVLQPGGPECIGTGHTGTKRRSLFGSDLYNLDFSAQGLTQG